MTPNGVDFSFSSTSCSCGMSMPADHACGGCSRAEWSQVGTETNYNRCRYAVLQQGQVGMFQVGSPTLGQLVGADDVEKAAVGWDVYKVAKLVDLKVGKPRQLCTECEPLSDCSKNLDDHVRGQI